MSVYDWFSSQIALAHSQGKVPHGPQLPESMPWIGDIFFLENEDDTDTMCVWCGGVWDKSGTNVARPKVSC